MQKFEKWDVATPPPNFDKYQSFFFIISTILTIFLFFLHKFDKWVVANPPNFDKYQSFFEVFPEGSFKKE